MAFRVTYADWLEHYAPRTKGRNTVNRYCRALNYCGEWLGIQLEKPILECVTLEEFSAIYDTLFSQPNFKSVNDAHGNGDLSAALNRYKEYLAFVEKLGSSTGDEELYTPAWFADQAKDLESLRHEDAVLRHSFEDQFGPETIAHLSGKELLTRMFYSDVENKSNMCYMLEFHPQMREIYGSIAGGSAFKFGLFYHKKNHCWTTGSPAKPQYLSEEEAIKIAETIRNNLLDGAEILDAHTFVSSVQDYELLYEELSHIPIIDNVCGF